MSKYNFSIKGFFSGLLKIYRLFRSVVFNLIFLFIVLLILSPLLSSPTLPVPANAALMLNLEGQVVEQKSIVNPMNQLANQASGDDDAGEILLQDVLDAINGAASDERITSMVIMTDKFQGGGFSHLRDIGNALQAFRATGKPVYGWGGSFNQAQYYLASQADEIMINPMGGVDLEGFGSWQMYYRDALDKLGVNVHIFRVGEYKAAVEPYERNDMSEAAAENYRQLLGELWGQYTADISARRNLEPDFLDDYINHMDQHLPDYDGNMAQLALGSGLVDRVESRPETLAYLQEKIGAQGDGLRSIGYQAYLKRSKHNENNVPPDQIALIVASGEIQDGEAPQGTVGADTLGPLIREARDDSRIKGLVLRIDSPGGSAFASEVIRGELESFRASGKPVVVSMGSVAASGGYWIATPANEIWASASTITGSIGIFGVMPTLENTFSKLGITVDGVGTTDMSGVGALGRGLTPLAERSIQLVIENGYKQFITLVANSRNMTLEQVDNIAQGRVWTGQAALDIGLVDKLGSLEDALASAANLAGVSSYYLRELSPPLSPMQQFVKGILENTSVNAILTPLLRFQQPSLAEQLLVKAQQELSLLERKTDPNGAYIKCVECTALHLW